MREIKTNKKNPLIKIFIKLCRLFGFEIIDQSNFSIPTSGKSLSEAFELAEEIENICHQYINTIKLGKPKILSDEEMKRILDKTKNYKKN